MYRVSIALARAVAAAFGATFLLSGCVGIGTGGPSALGSAEYGYRSIKDEPVPAPAAPTPAQAPAPKQAPAKTAIATPPPPKPRPRPPAAKRAELPTCATGSECMAQLKALIDDPARGWIGKVQAPAEYANGTRLFAYRALRTRLTCQELTTALGEITAAGKTFRAPVAGVTPLQVRRVLALNADVERELQAEFAVRCKS
jgi:hypothetical protein